MRILFVTATRVGDAVLSTGLLDHLLRGHPGAAVTVACGPAAEGVFARMPGRERTIVVTKRSWNRHWWTLWSGTVTRRWDLVVDLRGSAIGWLVPARRRAVIRGGRRAGHKLRHLAAVLRLDPPPRPVAWWDPADAARIAGMVPAGLRLVLGPTAHGAGKAWPAERFVALAQQLTAPDGLLAGARIVVLGGPGVAEARMAAPVLAGLGGAAVDLVGRVTLPEAAALLAGSALFVGNDSGLMHLAAAAGAPTLGLFGPSSVEEYAPAGRAVAVAVAPDSPAAGSIARLPLEAVIRAAAGLLAQAAAPAPA